MSSLRAVHGAFDRIKSPNLDRAVRAAPALAQYVSGLSKIDFRTGRLRPRVSRPAGVGAAFTAYPSRLPRAALTRHWIEETTSVSNISLNADGSINIEGEDGGFKDTVTVAPHQRFDGRVIMDTTNEALLFAKNEYKVPWQSKNRLALWTDASVNKTSSKFAIVWKNNYSDSHWQYRACSLKSDIDMSATLDSEMSTILEVCAICEAMKLAVALCANPVLTQQAECTRGLADKVSAVVIYSDSETALVLLRDHSSFSHGMQSVLAPHFDPAVCRACTNVLLEMGIKVELRIAPGHKGVEGNMLADLLCRRDVFPEAAAGKERDGKTVKSTGARGLVPG